MQNKLIGTVVGIVLAVGTGVLVYHTKQSPIVPLETGDNSSQIQANPTSAPTPTSNSGSNLNSNVSSKKEVEEEDDERGSSPSAPAPAPVPAVAPSGITMAQVSSHGSRSSCWSAINGNVYDLTSWIPNHPGGEQAILSLCGIDGSGGFNGQHGGQKKPASMLVGFKIGALVK